jgi:hypothetical protein
MEEVPRELLWQLASRVLLARQKKQELLRFYKFFEI